MFSISLIPRYIINQNSEVYLEGASIKTTLHVVISDLNILRIAVFFFLSTKF